MGDHLDHLCIRAVQGDDLRSPATLGRVARVYEQEVRRGAQSCHSVQGARESLREAAPAVPAHLPQVPQVQQARVQSTSNRIQSTCNRIQSTCNRVQSSTDRVQSSREGVQPTWGEGVQWIQEKMKTFVISG